MKSVIFVCNDESDSEKHLRLLQSQVEQVYVVERVKGVRNAYLKACEISPTEYFFIVDGDNEVYPIFNQNWINSYAEKPTIFWSNNEFNIQYGHGAIKLLCKEQFNNISMRPFVDLTENLFKNRYNVDGIVLSKHHLGTGFQKWRTIFREITKLTLRQNETLKQWLEFDENREIYQHVCSFIKASTPREICLILNDQDKLTELYNKYIFDASKNVNEKIREA